MALRPLSYLGSSWSLWPPHSNRVDLNIVTDTSKIASDIISVCLIRKGEDPIHPDFGIAPDLFEPLSNYVPQYWSFHIQEEIMRWVAGIERLRVEVVDREDYKNRLKAEISFVPRTNSAVEVLTFGYYEYQGAVWYQEFDRFLEDITLNGAPFTGLGYA